MRYLVAALATIAIVVPAVTAQNAESALTPAECLQNANALMGDPQLSQATWLEIRKNALRASEDPAVKPYADKPLALSYLFGPDVKEKGALAEPLLKAILERNPEDGQSAFFTAMGYHLGHFPNDGSEACTYFKQAALLNMPGAYWQTGMCYLNGELGEADEAEALSWVERAAELGDVNALISSGVMYAIGQGTEKDTEKAANSYSRAAMAAQPGSRNQMHAARALGAMHALGEISEPDEILGVALLVVARDGNDKFAGQILDTLDLTGDLDPNGSVIQSEIASLKDQMGLN